MENKELIFDSNIDKLIESADLTKEAPTEEPTKYNTDSPDNIQEISPNRLPPRRQNNNR